MTAKTSNGLALYEGVNELQLRVPAAERRKNVATGASPWIESQRVPAPGGAEDFLSPFESFAPSGAEIQGHCLPRACARGYILTPLRG